MSTGVIRPMMGRDSQFFWDGTAIHPTRRPTS